MADQVRLWSDELAHDPSSLVFLPLAETLRQRGQLELARKVAQRGIDRHPHNPDAHDQLARIHADAGELAAAVAEWELVLRLVPTHIGAMKGLAFARFQEGNLDEAERLLVEAERVNEGANFAGAIGTIRRSGATSPMNSGPISLPTDPRRLFADVLAGDQSAIMLDADGLVLAGAYISAGGRDLAEDVGVTLSGVSSEAQRATKHLEIGSWRTIVFETERAVVAITPAPTGMTAHPDGLLVLTTGASAPLGQLRRLLERCLVRAQLWIARGAGAGGAG